MLLNVSPITVVGLELNGDNQITKVEDRRNTRDDHFFILMNFLGLNRA